MSFLKMTTPIVARRLFLGQSGGLVLSGAAVALLAGKDALAAATGPCFATRSVKYLFRAPSCHDLAPTRSPT